MLKNTPENKKRFIFLNSLVSLLVFGFSLYWLYLCCGEHWRRAIGNQNLVFLLFVALFSFISLSLITTGHSKAYLILSFITFVPGLIVCFINRSAKYPDFAQLIRAFARSNPSDPVVQAMALIYPEDYQQYDYIVNRACSSSITLFVMLVLWLLLLIRQIIIKSKKRNENLGEN